MAQVVVVGGGIAGIAAAAHLSDDHEVTLLEAEASLAYHATGRSAALFFETYGHPAIRPLTKLSGDFFRAPPERFEAPPLLRRRGALTLGRPEDERILLGRVDEMGGAVEYVSGDRLAGLCPAVRLDRYPHGLWEPEAADMDVAAIHQTFVRWLRSNGGEVRAGTPVAGAQRLGSGWRVDAGGEPVGADVLINAAGAWGDVVAQRCGVAPIGLVPKRRTVFTTKAPDDAQDWPLVVDHLHTFYFKPDGPQLLCSPADETPQDPDDARPDEVDIALAIERINHATRLAIRSVRSSWAGQRTFAPDGSMVIGFDPEVEGFFWLVGQGGTGIQTAPAAGQLAAALVSSGSAPARFVEEGVDLTALAPGRLRA